MKLHVDGVVAKMPGMALRPGARGVVCRAAIDREHLRNRLTEMARHLVHRDKGPANVPPELTGRQRVVNFPVRLRVRIHDLLHRNSPQADPVEKLPVGLALVAQNAAQRRRYTRMVGRLSRLAVQNVKDAPHRIRLTCPGKQTGSGK